MIDNERVKNLSEKRLEQLSYMYDEFDCYGLDCKECPFELETPVLSHYCSLAYAKQLYGRLHE